MGLGEGNECGGLRADRAQPFFKPVAIVVEPPQVHTHIVDPLAHVIDLTRTQGAPLGDTVQEIRRAVGRWRGRDELDDDLTLLAASARRGGESAHEAVTPLRPACVTG